MIANDLARAFITFKRCQQFKKSLAEQYRITALISTGWQGDGIVGFGVVMMRRA